MNSGFYLEMENVVFVVVMPESTKGGKNNSGKEEVLRERQMHSLLYESQKEQGTLRLTRCL